MFMTFFALERGLKGLNGNWDLAHWDWESQTQTMELELGLWENLKKQ